MSQTNPRKAVLRNGAVSPAPTPPAEPTTIPAPPNHPLPQNPHKHRNNPKPFNQRSSPKPPAVNESPEIKELRKKYGNQLHGLKEMYPTWSDEDLLTLLNECNGVADTAASRIAEGRAEQWSVSGKKDKREKSAAPGGATSSRDRERNEFGGTTSPRPGRGGRGGSVRGGGAGRGRAGFAKGPQHGTHPVTVEAVADETGNGDANAWGQADSAPDGWGLNGTADKEKEKAPAAPKPQVAAGASAPKAQLPSKQPAAPAGPAKMSWAQVAKPKAKPTSPPHPKSLPPTTSGDPTAHTDDLGLGSSGVIVPSGTSDEGDGEVNLVESITTISTIETLPDGEVVATTEEIVTTWSSNAEGVTTVPADDWIHITTPSSIPVELPQAAEPEVIAIIVPEEQLTPAPPPPAVLIVEVVEATQPSPMRPPPPGLSTTPHPKPATPRMGSSHRKFKATDAAPAVVMPGGGLPTTTFGGLSFGNAVTGSGTSPSGMERFGMTFGSLNLDDDLDAPPLQEPSLTPEPVKEVHAPVPVAEVVSLSALTAVPQQISPQVEQQSAPTSAPSSQPHQSPRISTSSAINNLFQQAAAQHQQQQAQQHPQSLPQQVTSSTTPQPIADPLAQFGGLGGAPGLMTHLQQQAAAMQAHLPPAHHHHSPSQQPPPSLSYPASGLPHLDTSGISHQPPAPAHPAVAAQNSYFRSTESPYLLAPTPQQSLQQQQDQMNSPYGGGAFTPLGAQAQQQQQQAQLGGFAASPAAAADYGGYDAQGRGFYDSYNQQPTTFQNRTPLGHDDSSKQGLAGTPTSGLPAQQGGGQPGAPGAQGFGMMPYYPYQQPYWPPHQFNPYSAPNNPYKYAPQYSQPPPGAGGPAPLQQPGNKPPSAAAASPYGSQHYPAQPTGYDDAAYGQAPNVANDYQKQQQQQQPLYGSQGSAGMQNFAGNFGAQAPAQNGPQQQPGGARSGPNSTSPENAYKGYGGAASGPGVTDKTMPPQGRGAGGPQQQPQQNAGYYNRYSAPQPQQQAAAQAYPPSDGQQFYGYQQQRQYW